MTTRRAASITRRAVLALGVGAAAGAMGALWRRAGADDAGPAILGPLPDTAGKGALVWDPTAQGYVAEEFFLRGWADVTDTVTMADAIDTAARDNFADLGRRKFPLTQLDAGNLYVTRLIVYRPREPTRFSGRAIIETLHPVGGGTSPVWSSLSAFFMARGDAVICVQHPVTFAGLKTLDPARYGPLDAVHPSLLWGMLADAGRLAKQQVLMPTLNVRRAYLTGYSFTGVAAATFANYHHERAALHTGEPIFDGYAPMANACYVRPLDVPVIRLNTQSDFAEFGGVANRALDSDARRGRSRLYELAGAAHVVAPWPAPGGAAAPRAVLLAPAPGQPHVDPSTCYARFPPGASANDMPVRIAQAGVMSNLYDWAEKAISPPHTPRLVVDARGRAKLDAHGNALGGLRLPQMSAPIASYGVGESAGGAQGGDLCNLFGFVARWDEATLRALYKTPQAWRQRFGAQAAALVRQRLITASGADDLVTWSRAVTF